MTWLDEGEWPYIAGEAREAIEDLIREQDLPPPTDWDSLDVKIFPDDQHMVIHAGEFDYEYDVTDSDIRDIENWNWIWDVWAWAGNWDIERNADVQS